MVQSPATPDRVPSPAASTAQTPSAAKLTGRPELAVALSWNGGAVVSRSGRVAKVMVWAVFSTKVAVTLRAALMVRLAGLVVPVRSPLQPVKRQPSTGAAVMVATLSAARLAAQVLGHSMPEPDTEP